MIRILHNLSTFARLFCSQTQKWNTPKKNLYFK